MNTVGGWDCCCMDGGRLVEIFDGDGGDGAGEAIRRGAVQ